jgi:hypothetical protein
MPDIANIRRAGDRWSGTSFATPLILFHLVQIVSELERAETRFRDNAPRLRSGEPSTASAAAAVLEQIVRTATEYSERWERLRLQVLEELGLYLLRNPCRQGRPPKVSTVDTLLSLAEQGVSDRRIAHRARLVARIPEKVRRAYIETTEQPTERGLHRYAKEQQRSFPPQPRYWLTPPELKRRLETEFGKLRDVCPYPRPAGYDALTSSWGKPGDKAYCNPPFSKRRSADADKHGPTDFIRKGISENRTRDVEVIFVLPIPHYVAMLAEAGAELRSLGRVHWLEATSGEPHPSPPNCALFILRGRG